MLFYGGKLLAHLSFEMEGADLVRVMEVNRHASILIDSDRSSPKTHVSATKKRIQQECEKRDIHCWITKGREIENYLNGDLLKKLNSEFPSISAKGPLKKSSMVRKSTRSP